MISIYHKALFVHIPKTGGQSVEEAFLKDIDPHLTWARHRRLFLCMPRMTKPEAWPGPERLAHLKAREYVDLDYLPKSYFDRLFKFALVRNPFSRVESHYFYSFHDRIGFRDFVLNVLPEARARHFFFAPQSDYLLDGDGKQLTDQTYRLEEIVAAWQDICGKTGVTATLPVRNNSANRKAVEWLPEMIEVVRTCYSQDFELLGYPDTV